MADLFDYVPPPLPQPKPSRAFDGETYDVSKDYARLKGQLGRVFSLMIDGRWRTLAEIRDEVGGSEAACSARLRDLRKEKYGNFAVARERVAGVLYRYRLDRKPPE